MLDFVFFPFIVALLVTIILIPPLMKVAGKAGLLDIPNPRKIHHSAIPRVGGIALGIGSILSILFWLPIDRELSSILTGFGILLIFGAWDDKANIDYRIKFLSQFTAAIIVVWYGGVLIHRVPLIEVTEIPIWFTIPLTILFVVGITNAINLSDGLDGLSGGKTLLIFGCMAILAYHERNAQLLLLNAIFAGAILGFLRFNTYPAQVFMGDAGSQALGFTSAVLALNLTQHPNPTLSPALPLLFFALAICDTASVIVQRVSQGRSPFAPDNNHFHHKLLALGFSHFGAITLIYVVQTILVTVAYFTRYESDELVVGIFAGFSLSVVILLALRKNSRSERERDPGSEAAMDPPNSVFATIGAYSSYFLLPALLVAGIVAQSNVPKDLGVAAGIILIALGVCLASRPGLARSLFRLSAYLACAFSIYLLNRNTENAGLLEPYISIGFALLAITTCIGIRFSTRQAFRVTPLDFLIIFMCLVVPAISIFVGRDLPVAAFSGRLVVLMYACEYVFSSKNGRIWESMLGPAGLFTVILARILS